MWRNSSILITLEMLSAEREEFQKPSLRHSNILKEEEQSAKVTKEENQE